MIATNLIAWWGAVVATLVLIWDVAKWMKTGPGIRVRVQSHTWYADGRVVRVEKTEHGEAKELAEYCHIEVVNIGTSATTVLGIAGSHKVRKAPFQMSISSQRFTPHHGKHLPHVLPPGEVWSCRLEMADLFRLNEHGKPYIEVHFSHKRNPLMIWPKLSTKRRLQRTDDSGDQD